MDFLNDIISSYDSSFGYQLVVLLQGEWEKAARNIRPEQIAPFENIILKPSVDIAQKVLAKLGQTPLLRWSDKGLQAIDLDISNRVGINLEGSHNYISHNFTQPEQVAAVIPIFISYLKTLEGFVR